MAVPISNMAATWNTSPTSVNTAIGMNVTDVMSQAWSALIELNVNNNVRFSVDKRGRTILGNDTWNTTMYDYQPGITVSGELGGSQDISLNGYYNSIMAPSLQFIKSRSATAGGHTVVQNGDNLMWIAATGANGSPTYDRESAAIAVRCDGTPTGASVPGALAFFTTYPGDQYATERFTITATGDIGMGTSAPFLNTTSFVNTFDPVITEDGGYFGGGLYYNSGWRNTTDSQGGWAIRNSGGVFTVYTGPANGASGNLISAGERMRIGSTGTTNFYGSVLASGDVTAYATSDRNLKTNITPIKDALEKIKQITGVMFDWKDEEIEARGGEDGYYVRKHDTGVIAQDVEAVLPEVVGIKENGTKAVRYEKLAGLIIQAIKELSDKVDKLEKKIK